MSDLPDGWKVATLGEVAAWGSGGTPTRTVARYYGGEIPWAVIGDLNDGLVERTSTTITEDGLKESSAKLVTPGTVLVAMYGSIGKLGIAGTDMATNQAIAFATPNPDVLDGRYLFHYLASQRRQLAGEGRGATQQNIGQAILKGWPIPVPSTREQGRIVAAIEEHLTRLDAASAWLRSALVRLTALRRLVIDAALEGHPVPLRQVLAEPLRNGMSGKPMAGGSLRVLTLTAVTKREFIDANTKLIAAPSRSIDDLWLEPGDIFIQRSNTPELVGSAAMYSGEPRWAIFPDLLIRVRLSDAADPAYVDLALQAQRMRRYFQRSAQGIAGSMPKISQPVVEAAEIPLPDPARQREIVAVTTERLEAVDRMSKEALGSIRRVRSLRVSLLDAAFSGRLVDQDPRDEPAAFLVDRTQAGRSTKAHKTKLAL